jgi:hypothetical protein
MQYNPSLEASGRSGSQELLTLDESKDPFTLFNDALSVTQTV